jgi:hypothetical protein
MSKMLEKIWEGVLLGFGVFVVLPAMLFIIISALVLIFSFLIAFFTWVI